MTQAVLHASSVLKKDSQGVLRLRLWGQFHLVSQETGCVRLWDLRTGQVRHTLPVLAKRIEVVGDLLLVSSAQHPLLFIWWLTRLDAPPHVLRGHNKWITSLCVHEGLLFTSSADGTSRAWQLPLSDSEVGNPEDPDIPEACRGSDAVDDSDNSGDDDDDDDEGRVASEDDDDNGGDVNDDDDDDDDDDVTTSQDTESESSSPRRAWTTPKHGTCTKLSCLAVLMGHTDYVNDVVVSSVPEPCLVSASCDNDVRLWSLAPLQARFSVLRDRYRSSPFLSRRRQPDAAPPPPPSVSSLRSMHVLSGHTGWVFRTKVVDWMMVSASKDGTVRQWDLRSQTCVRVLSASTSCLEAHVSLDLRFVYVKDASMRVTLWNARSGKRLQSFEGHSDKLTETHIPDQAHDFLLTASRDNTLRQWRADGTCSAVCRGHERPVNSVVIMNGIAYTGSDDGSIRTWFLPQVNWGHRVGNGHIQAKRSTSAGNSPSMGGSRGLRRSPPSPGPSPMLHESRSLPLDVPSVLRLMDPRQLAVIRSQAVIRRFLVRRRLQRLRPFFSGARQRRQALLTIMRQLKAVEAAISTGLEAYGETLDDLRGHLSLIEDHTAPLWECLSGFTSLARFMHDALDQCCSDWPRQAEVAHIVNEQRVSMFDAFGCYCKLYECTMMALASAMNQDVSLAIRLADIKIQAGFDLSVVLEYPLLWIQALVPLFRTYISHTPQMCEEYPVLVRVYTWHVHMSVHLSNFMHTHRRKVLENSGFLSSFHLTQLPPLSVSFSHTSRVLAHSISKWNKGPCVTTLLDDILIVSRKQRLVNASNVDSTVARNARKMFTLEVDTVVPLHGAAIEAGKRKKSGEPITIATPQATHHAGKVPVFVNKLQSADTQRWFDALAGTVHHLSTTYFKRVVANIAKDDRCNVPRFVATIVRRCLQEDGPAPSDEVPATTFACLFTHDVSQVEEAEIRFTLAEPTFTCHVSTAVHALARFLLNLKASIIPADHMAQVHALAEEPKAMSDYLASHLPESNRDTLHYLVNFVRRLTERENSNVAAKVSSAFWGPCILRPTNALQEAGDWLQRSEDVMRCLLTHFDTVFPNPLPVATTYVRPHHVVPDGEPALVQPEWKKTSLLGLPSVDDDDDDDDDDGSPSVRHGRGRSKLGLLPFLPSNTGKRKQRTRRVLGGGRKKSLDEYASGGRKKSSDGYGGRKKSSDVYGGRKKSSDGYGGRKKSSDGYGGRKKSSDVYGGRKKSSDVYGRKKSSDAYGGRKKSSDAFTGSGRKRSSDGFGGGGRKKSLDEFNLSKSDDDIVEFYDALAATAPLPSAPKAEEVDRDSTEGGSETGNSVDNSEPTLLSGWLLLRRPERRVSQWKKKWVILSKSMLTFWKNDDANQLVQIMWLKSIQVTMSPTADNVFELCNGNTEGENEVTLSAKDVVARQGWVDAILRAQLKLTQDDESD